MKQAETISLEALLPKGIRVRKGKKSVSIVVQTRKQVKDGDVTKIIPDFKTVRLDLPKNYSSEQYRVAFMEALEEAKKEKVLAFKHIAVHGLDAPKTSRRGAVGTLKEVYDLVFEKQWKGKPQERNMVIYERDIFSFFPKTISMHEMQTPENYDNFVAFMTKRITERKMNNFGTCTTNTINRRLGVIRCCIAYAIQYGFMDKNKVLNPDPRELSNYGWKNLPLAKVKDKHALTVEEEQEVISKCKELGDDEFSDAFAWLIDTGMRYETEFLTFTIKDINWKTQEISFWREKTKQQSINLPLSDRAFAIAKRYKEVALTKQSQRMFGLSKHKIEAMFHKYKDLCKIEDFTPYITRRSFGTRLGDRLVQPKVIAKMMGHACVETAQRYYIQPTDKGYKRAVKLSELTDVEFDSFLTHQNTLIGHNSRKKD